jgi:hypothetical protein
VHTQLDRHEDKTKQANKGEKRREEKRGLILAIKVYFSSPLK